MGKFKNFLIEQAERRTGELTEEEADWYNERVKENLNHLVENSEWIDRNAFSAEEQKSLEVTESQRQLTFELTYD